MKFKEYLKEGKSDFYKDDVDYIIRELGKGKYEISVWKRGDTPSAVYTCTEKGNCTCPARGTCKHVKLVKDWIKAGKPNKFFTKNVKAAVQRGLKKIGVKT